MKKITSIKIIFKEFVCFLFLLLIFSYFIPIYADDIEDVEKIEETNISGLSIEASSTDASSLNLNARSCIVLDRNSQKILYGKNEYNKVKMASTTKIMTATIIIENCNLNDTVVVSKKAASTGGSRLGLKTGDTITISDLLYGLMLCSGNDAAVCLAETTAGSVADFATLMNNKAQELGLTNTHFESPHGLDSDGHYTTAYELAILSNYAMKNSTFSKIVGTKTYTVTINGYPKTLSNTNELLGNLDGVYGIKTGFTNGANRCLVTCCKRNDIDIICVVLGCDTKKFRTQDSIKLIEYAFSNFEPVNIQELANNEFENWKEDNLNSFSVIKGVSNEVHIYLDKFENSIIPINKNDIPNIEILVKCEKELIAPIDYGTSIGYVSVVINGDVIEKANICVSDSIPKKSFIDYLYEFFKKGFRDAQKIPF